MVTMLTLLPLAPVWMMALPPQSDDDLRQQAQRVVVAQVLEVTQREVEVPQGTDLHFVAKVKPVEGEPFEVRFRQTRTRPPGWSGPVGQEDVLKAGQRVRLFLRQHPDGGWALLEPNGWTKAD